jgi:hypothetical protein
MLARIVRKLPEALLAGIGLLLLLWIVPTMHSRVSAKSNEETCRNNMEAILQAIQRYRADHGGNFPPVLVAMSSHGPGLPEGEPLVPKYLDLARLVCPADPTEGQRGWLHPCTYEYELQELSFPNPEVRRQVRTRLISPYGSRLRLLLCSNHQGRNPGFLTIRADGLLAREVIEHGKDPQKAIRMSLWELQMGHKIDEHRQVARPVIQSAPGQLPLAQGH